MSRSANKRLQGVATRRDPRVSPAEPARGGRRRLPAGASRAADRIRIKRAYEPASAQDGHRVLVDRMWPRGRSKQALHIDSWLKDVAPSTPLRKWFGHDPSKWKAFRTAYQAELAEKSEEIEILTKLWRAGVVTLVYAARDAEHNNAVALAEYLWSIGRGRGG